VKKESVIVVIPLPVRVLSPNVAVATPGGRFAKAAAIKRYRKLVYEAIQDERIESAPWNCVQVESVFFFQEKRRRDTDNAIGRLKPVYDGIVDSGLIPDDDPEHMVRMPPIFRIDPINPRLVLTIWRIT